MTCDSSFRPSIVLLTGTNTGGMGHYASNLEAALRPLTPTRLRALEEFHASRGNASVASRATFVSRVRSYSPLFYRYVARRIVDEDRPDVIHITSRVIGLRALATALARAGIKVVITVHDPVPHEETRTAWGRIYQRYQSGPQMKAVLSKLAAVHVHSQEHVRILSSMYGSKVANTVYVVPHGGGITNDVMQGGLYPSEIRGALDPDCATILFFGRIEPYKGLHQLFAAVERLESDGTRVNLVVAGAGTIDRSGFAELRSNVVIVNRFIHDREIRAIFQSADIVALPYVSGTQSGVIPLAYSFAKPVVATDVGALRELIDDGTTGYVVAPGKVDALAFRLAELAREPTKARLMGDAGLEFMQRRFSWDSVARRHLAIYKRISA